MVDAVCFFTSIIFLFITLKIYYLVLSFQGLKLIYFFPSIKPGVLTNLILDVDNFWQRFVLKAMSE